MRNLIMNGVAVGAMANAMMSQGFDTGMNRPWIEIPGHVAGQPLVIQPGQRLPSYVVLNGKTQRITDNAASLLKDEWIQMDETVQSVAKPLLKVVGWHRSRGLTYGIKNGMGTEVLQWQNSSDVNAAQESMDALRSADDDMEVFDLNNLPLPITHADWSITARQLATLRANGRRMDMDMVEKKTRRVVEQVEQRMIGTSTAYYYGGGYAYGWGNHPSRITKTLTAPTAVGWTPQVLLQEVLDMREALRAVNRRGPLALFFASAWDEYLDDDFSAAKGELTVRERLAKISKIETVETLDYASNYDVFMVQATNDTTQLVSGMDIQVLQWESHGGLKLNFKVMCIWVPRVRGDYNASLGVVHGSTA